MSILIRGMTMPENCQDCTFCDYETDYEESGYYVCHAIPKQIIPTYTERNDDCPLIEIDFDALVKRGECVNGRGGDRQRQLNNT